MDGRRREETDDTKAGSALPINLPMICNHCDGQMGPVRRNPKQSYWFTQKCMGKGEKECERTLHIFSAPTRGSLLVCVWDSDAEKQGKSVLQIAQERSGTYRDQYPALAAPG